MSDDVVRITVNGGEVDAKPGELVIAAAERAGEYIPRFCYHPRMSSVGMCRQCMVEIDQLGMARARPPNPGGFPAGIAMVSILVDDLDAAEIKPVWPAQELPGRLYAGQPVMVCRGAGGELIELIQAVH